MVDHEFKDGVIVRAMYDGFDSMYRKGERAEVLSSGVVRGVLYIRVKINERRILTVYADNWEVANDRPN